MRQNISISTIYRSTRHFYLNYHNAETSSLYLYSAFTRHLQFALRLVTTLLVSGFLGYATPLGNKLVQLYMIPNIGTTIIQETFGYTLSNSLQITVVIAPLSVFLFVAQKIGLSYHDYAAGEVLLLFTSFYISYQCQQLQVRKICLWYNVIYFATIITSETVQFIFVFQLLSTFLLGMCVALIVSLLIFPLFATCDIENRFNYCLLHLNQMQTFVLEAFLTKDTPAAKVSLARAKVVEQRLRETMNQMQLRFSETRLEPSRILQRIFNRRRRHLINLTIQEEEDLINSLMFHVCSMQTMVEECQFTKYHNDLVDNLESKFFELISCQSTVISGLIATPSTTTDEFTHRLTNFQTALDSLNSGYKQVRLHLIEEACESKVKARSDAHLSHAFFFFQLGAIARLLIQSTVMNSNRVMTNLPKKKRCLKDFFKFKFDRARLLSAIKSTLIIGIGSVFVMIPSLSNVFTNGQWVLIALCMTQGDTVGGAFTTMRMRFLGTLLGSMWAYVIYIAVEMDTYKILAMLVPWSFLFGYLKLSSKWDSTASVAISTPITANLGRLYSVDIPQLNYVILRIQANVVGIGLGIVLTMLIFPIFAVDSLKSNIQDTLKTCSYAATSIHSAYDQFFKHEHSRGSLISMDRQEDEATTDFDIQRSQFHELINAQRELVIHASREPSLWWFNYGFSRSRYDNLVKEEVDLFQMLHCMNATLTYINEYNVDGAEQIENLRHNAASNFFLPDLHSEVTSFIRHLDYCVNLWSSYFTLTQTTYYRCSHLPRRRRKKQIKGDLSENRQCLIELYQTVTRVQARHQQVINSLLDYFLERMTHNQRPMNYTTSMVNDHSQSIFETLSAMYYSTIQLAEIALALGTTIHTIFELETTTIYRDF